MKSLYIDEMNKIDHREAPQDFLEYSEPCTEGRKWELLHLLELANVEVKNHIRELTSRINSVQYEAEAYELEKELYKYIDTSSWSRQKDIKRIIDERVNRKNT